MSFTTFRRTLQAMPPGSTVPVEWVLEHLPEDHRPTEWVGSSRASEITGLTQASLRSSAPRWALLEHPPIRVSKRDPSNHRSWWVFHEPDCWQYRRSHGGGPQASSLDESEQIVALCEEHLE